MIAVVKIHFPPEWGVEPVPARHRILGALDYFVLWSSLGVGLLVLAAGALLVPALSLFEALVAILVGTVIGSLLLASVGLIGGRQGLPTMVIVRPAFGVQGSYIPAALNVFQLVGWTIFELIIMAQAANFISETVAGVSAYPLWVLVFAVIVGAMALFGPIAIIRQWLEKFAIWLVYGSSLWILYYLVQSFDLTTLFAKPASGGMSFLTALDIVIAMPISWMPLVADYNRFTRSLRGGFWGTFTGYTIANVWFYALGALLVLSGGTADVVSALGRIGFGLLALFLILVDETDNAFADVYSAAVSTQNIVEKAKQRRLIIAYVVLSGALALLIPLTQYEVFLLLIGAAFIPAFGVVLADHYLVRRRATPANSTAIPKRGGSVSFTALLAWGIGALVYYVLSPLSFFFVPGLPQIGASIPSLITAALVYFVLWRLSPQGRRP